MVKPTRLNAGPSHFSCLTSGEEAWDPEDNLLNVQLFYLTMVVDYFTNIVHFMSTWMAPKDYTVA